MKTTGIQILFFNHKDEVLLLKRYAKSDWELFSSSMIQNEGEYQTANRGAQLSLGLELDVAKLFPTRKYYQFHMNHDNRGDVNLLTFLYTLKATQKPKLNKDHYADYIWINKDTMVDFIIEKKLKSHLIELQPMIRDYFEKFIVTKKKS